MPKVRYLWIPTEVRRQLWLTARRAGVPIEEVMRTAFASFARLDPDVQIEICAQFWRHGDQDAPAAETSRPPVFADPVWDEEAGRWVYPRAAQEAALARKQRGNGLARLGRRLVGILGRILPPLRR